MQQILNVITPATSYDLVSLTDMKLVLGIPPANTANDVLIQELISSTSETIAKMCNRVFGYEKVDETFYQLEDQFNPYSQYMYYSMVSSPSTQRLYLSRWPVVKADIISLTQDGNDLLASENATWMLEEETGTLYSFPPTGPWIGVIDVQYSGGYLLPTNAPGPLQFAMKSLTREAYAAWTRNPSLYGVRQIAHKESRIGYYAPNLMSSMGTPETWKNVENILNKYIRHWV
jgi:hypothetical protein